MTKFLRLIARGRMAIVLVVVVAMAAIAPAVALATGPEYAKTIEPLTNGTKEGFLEVVPPVLAVLAVLLVIALIVNFARKHLKKA